MLRFGMSSIDLLSTWSCYCVMQYRVKHYLKIYATFDCAAQHRNILRLDIAVCYASGMARKQCAQTDKALKLVAKGMSYYKAAAKAGISPSTLYRALPKAQKPVEAIP